MASEYLVMGAMLECSYGTEKSSLVVPGADISINELPKATVNDNKPGENLFGFGACERSGGLSCANTMFIRKKWENTESVATESNGYKAITMTSVLQCAVGGVIVPLTSGQCEYDLLRLLGLLSDMEREFPGLAAILDDLQASLFLNEGMRELALRFLDYMIEARGGEINLALLFADPDIYDWRIISAIQKLIGAHGTNHPSAFLPEVEGAIARMNLRNGAHQHRLDALLMEVLHAESEWRANLIANSWIHQLIERNIGGSVAAADTVNQMAFAFLGIGSMRIGANTQLVNKVTRGTGGSTGTVWDNIRPTQPNIPGTNIPRSFELNAGGTRFWVHGNATKHMGNYSTRTLSHGRPMTDQQLLTSFNGAVTQAKTTGFTYNVPIRVGNWELIFSPARQAGQLPVIKHAIYIP